MSRYDGLIIPRSYSEYINKTDAATLLQALQLSGVMDAAPTANSNHPVKSGGVDTAITNAIKALRYMFSYYLPGFTGVFKISIPYTNNSNTTPVGSIIINARSGNSYLFNFYAFVNESSSPQAPEAGKVFQLPGNVYSGTMLEPYLKWSVDSDNHRINYYLKKASGPNSRIVMSLLSYYQPGTYDDDITITAQTETTEWDSAQNTNDIIVIGNAGQ